MIPQPVPPLEIRMSREPGRPLAMQVSGELDLLTKNAVAQAIAPYAQRAEPLMLDLSGITFADSSSVHMLLGLSRDALERGWEFAVAEPSQAMAYAIGLCEAGEQIPAVAG